jgi:nucleotide-binding universal stress UspA family protein
MIKGKVLVAVDGSVGAAHALRWAADRATAAGSELRVMTAWETPALLGFPAGAGIVVPTEAELAALGQQLLDEAIADAAPDHVQTAQRSVRHGRPGIAVLEEVESFAPDLVVVGTHGHSAIARVLLGSVSANIAAHAPCPVVVVPEQAKIGQDGPVRVGFDGSDGSRAALAWVAHHASCPIEVVHAWKVPKVFGAPRHSSEEIEASAIEVIESVVAPLPVRDRVMIKVVEGEAREVLLKNTSKLAALVVGRRRTGPLAALLGSVSTYVACHADLPVVVVPPPEVAG